MKTKIKVWILLLMVCFVSSSGVVLGEEWSAYEVMKKVDERDTGETSISDRLMILIDRKGNQRVRQTKGYTKEFEDVTKTMTFFLTPADVKDTTFLSFDWENETQDDDSWLYLPALRKVKRLASSDKSGSFMGSDFSYADVEGVNVEEYDYKFLKKSEMVDGHDTWVIQSKPKKALKKKVINKTGYVKSNLWVRKDILMTVKGKFWVKKGKKIKYMTVSDIKNVDGIWTAYKLQMVTTKKKKVLHSTVLQTNSITYNVALEDDTFTTQRMTRGS